MRRSDRAGPTFLELRKQGAAAFGAGLYREAAASYQESYVVAISRGDYGSALKLRNNYASANLARFQYGEALKAYLDARTLGLVHGTNEERCVIDFNLASLYIVLGDLYAANRSAEEGLNEAGNSDPYGYRHELLRLLGGLRARQGATAEAISYFHQAILAADRKGNTSAMAKDWDHLGEEMLLKRDYPAAEQALTEAFRLRTLTHDRDLRTSVVKLAWLRLTQGDLPSAEALIQRATAMPATDTGMPPWFISYLHGRILQGQGKPKEALAVFGEALRSARQWQIEAAPSGIPSEYAQSRLNELYTDFVDSSLNVDPHLALDAFAATERDRAAALNQMLMNSRTWREHLPAAYWSSSDRLRRARASDLLESTPKTRAEIARWQDTLAESLQGSVSQLTSTRLTKFLERNTAVETLRHIQEGIRPGEVLLSFHTGERMSALWAVSTTKVELYRLPSRGELSEPVNRFREAIRNGGPSRDELGHDLYIRLFGRLSAGFRQDPLWIITSGDTFFEIPFGALVSEIKDAKPVYLIEQHALLYTPSAAMLGLTPPPPPETPFVGVGDGIYNAADPRWPALRAKPWTKPLLQLPRLPGSKSEIQACSQAWNSGRPGLLLTGSLASRSSLETALRSAPGVVHFAAHVLSPAGRKNEAAIDLGLTSTGQPDLLTKEDIEAMHVPGATVVMSGCSSAASESVPTAGVLGLTRAWLVAGARVVIGSRWPTPDDTGELFRSFYRHLSLRRSEGSRARAAAYALNQAQLEMLRSNSWRSGAGYWSAYYLVGTE